MSVPSLQAEARRWLSEAGFEVEFCQGIDLRDLQDRLTIPPLVEWSFNGLKRPIGFWLLKQFDRLFPKAGWNRRFRRAIQAPGPNLCAIARRPTEV